MIGSSVLCSSFWNPIDDLDVIPFADGPLVLAEDIEINAVEDLLNWGAKHSPVHSSGSEDFDSLSHVERNDELLPVPDEIESELLKDELVDSIDFDDLDWCTFSSNETEGTLTTDSSEHQQSSPKVHRRKRKRTKSPDHLLNSKSWSKMSNQERLKIAYALSYIVTHRMGFLEQIEVIKMINPSVDLTANTKEFCINISHLNNSKLKRIREYVRKHTFRLEGDAEISSFYNLLMGDATADGQSTKQRRRKPKSPYKSSSENNYEKKVLQIKKERSSGLFLQEKLIKKLSIPEEEEEEINILE